jgi:catechol 2,3-dioxygenase-like lactoylglutathione lyase family enzyme
LGHLSGYLKDMENPIQITGFDHIVLRVRDRAAMLDFYQRVLGLEVDWDRPELGLTHIRAGSQLIDLVTLDGPLGRKGGRGPGSEGRNLDHFALQVRLFDHAAIQAHLAAHGVEIVEEGDRYGAGGDGPSLYIRDPEGNVIELKGPGRHSLPPSDEGA